MGEMDRWMAAAAAELGVADEVLADVTHPVLDLVRDIAHGVNRPSAPLSAFLVGLAAGLATSGADAADAQSAAVLARVDRLRALAEEWEPAEG